MGTKFNDYLAEKTETATPEERELDEAFAVHFQAVYEEHFGLGAQIAAARGERHLTQDALATLSGVPQPEISRIENGQANPTQDTLAKLLSPLGLILAAVSPSARPVAH